MQDFEEAFLACVMIQPDILFKTTLREEQFLSGQPRQLFRAMRACADSGVVVDYVALHEIDKTMDPTYAARLHDMLPSGANWKLYETKVKESYQRNKLVSLGMMLKEIGEGDPVEYIERAEHDLLELSTDSQETAIARLREVILPTLKEIEARYKNKGKLPGLSTGLDDLDGVIGGLQAGRYYVIGARPSDGKSALAVNMLCHIGFKEHVPVGLISAESSNVEVCTRMFSAEGHINGQIIHSGFLSPADFQSIYDTGMAMAESPIFLYDAPNVRFQEAKSVARQMVAIHKVKAVFVDYLQILQWHNQAIQKHEQVAAISLGLKEMARELKIPVIALSQLKRDAEGREPDMADLDYSKQIEQDADAIVLIYHPKAEKDEVKPSMLLVKKNRDGPKGAVFVSFQREYVRFYPTEHQPRRV